jgi:hypothetical protein
VRLTLLSTGPVELGFAPVGAVRDGLAWPGSPLLCITDDRAALVAARQGAEVTGHWSTAPTFVAAARAVVNYCEK